MWSVSLSPAGFVRNSFFLIVEHTGLCKMRFMLRLKFSKAGVVPGRDKYGPLFEYKKQANANSEVALNEKTVRSDSLGRTLQNQRLDDFWKDKEMINRQTSLPSRICFDEISQLWIYCYDLFNCEKTISLKWAMKMRM